MEENKDFFDDLEESFEILIELTLTEQIRNSALKDDSLLHEALISQFT